MCVGLEMAKITTPAFIGDEDARFQVASIFSCGGLRGFAINLANMMSWPHMW